MKIKNILRLYLFQRNWHYTLNRRLRNHHWDLRPWPNQMALFGFNPEFSDLITQTSDADMNDLSQLLEGLSLIVKMGGKTYSQLCQEAFVVAHIKNEKKPFYLEIGAYHPEKYSNTASLRQFMGWSGLSIDPSEESRMAFEAAGLKDQFLNMGVGASSGTAFFLSDGAFSQTLQKETDRTSEISIIGIRELLDLCPDVHYVSLDIEGGEVEIIKAFPWDACKPNVFTIEHNHNPLTKNELNSLMSFYGYRRVLDSVTNFESWFVLEM